MKYLLITIGILVAGLTLTLHAIDLTSELVISGADAQYIPMTTHTYGTIFARLIDTDKVTSELHYQFGDNKQNINVAYVKFMRGNIDITVGRQLMAWGSGYNFNPTDIFNSKPLGAAFDPAYTKTGRDAITLDSYWDGLIAEVIFAPGYYRESIYDASTTITENGQEDWGVRLKKNLFNYDITLSYVRLGQRTYNGAIESSDDLYGISAKGSLPVLDWGVWLEAAQYTQQRQYELTCGLEYFWGDWTFNLEYFRNGFGNADKTAYDLSYLLRGRTLGRDYLIPSVSLVIDEKLTLSGFAFYNINDTSSITGGVIDYFYNDTIEIVFMPFFINGDSSSEYGLQKAAYGDYGVQYFIKATF
ncbi:MAG: hypothetical protein ABIH39_01295 [Candidatus Margulisiibacteriota bacterium]